MEVKIRPLYGCLLLFLGGMTLGFAPLMWRLDVRHWPRSLDKPGLLTHGGTRIPWSEFTKITHVITTINSGIQAEHFELKYPKGKVVVAPYRLADGQRVLEYVAQHLPEDSVQI